MMSKNLHAIPADCLKVLGGLQTYDPPVLVRSPSGIVWTYHPMSLYTNPLLPSDRILLPQSEAAVRAILIRFNTRWAVHIPVESLAHVAVCEAILAAGVNPGWSPEILRV